MIQRVAAESRRRYPFVDRDDVQQELALWMITHEDLVRKWREHEWGGLWKSLINCARAYCEREKAYVHGYEPEDVFFYSLGHLQMLLPQVFEEDWGYPTSSEVIGQRGLGDPATGGDLMTMVVDVRRALKGLDDASVALLQLAAEYGFDYDMMSVNGNAVKVKVYRALRRLQDRLGGPNPYREPKT